MEATLVLLGVCALQLGTAIIGFADEVGDGFNGTSLPVSQACIKGNVGLRPSGSVKDYPAEAKAPAGAPNMRRISTGDVGYGASSTFDGLTPTCDRVATAGVFERGVGFPGRNTSWCGKNHDVADWPRSRAALFGLWPVGPGFEDFYGFDENMTNKAIAWMPLQHAAAPDRARGEA